MFNAASLKRVGHESSMESEVPHAYVYVTVLFENLFHALCFAGYVTEVPGYVARVPARVLKQK